jgi:hypothetical protein
MTDNLQERAANQTAYRRLKASLPSRYGPGRFVAIRSGEVVADAGRFADLRSRLAEQGIEPAQVLIVQVGVEYPETAVIFASNRHS